jgi:hypothetical protein
MFVDHREAASMGGDLFAAAGKSAPPVAVAGMTVAGVGLQDWVLIATLLWLGAQLAYLAWKWVRESRSA